MTTPLRASSVSFQRGAATLFMTLMLLLVAGLVLLYTSRGAIMEQRLSANEIRAKQAFAAASAGLDRALAAIQAGTGAVPTVNATTLSNSGGANTSSYYTVAFCQPNATATCPAAHGTAPTCSTGAATSAKDVLVASCGWSDDDSAVHLVSQRVVGTPSLPSSVPNPLISRGAAGLTTGGASVFNYFSDLTVWSGQAMTSLSNNSKTFVRDTANPNHNYTQGTRTTNIDGAAGPDYLNPMSGGTANCGSVTGYTCSSAGTTLGHDTVTGDTRLTEGSGDDYFKMFLGDTPANYRDVTADWKVDLNSSLATENSTDPSSLNGMTDKSIWVAGDLTVPANTVIGSPSNPVILVVDGNMHLSNNFTIYGVVYARGDIDGNGSPTIVGSMITQGSVNINGSPNIIYDPFTGTKIGQDGKATKLPAQFQDW